MIQYKRHVLNNGLRVIIHQDNTTPMAVVNLLYEVGSKHELASKTGFAHLFEHLMFSGTKDIPDYDQEIELAAGENNAFTNADITNYYDVLPVDNIETGIWLEADRMANLDINLKALEIQKKVVIEEFYETCLNLPYGDAWHHIVKMAYGDHPYSWPTIGITPEHIKDATIDDVQSFFDTFYIPSNAILVLAGNVDEDVIKLAEKWFDSIPNYLPAEGYKPSLPAAIIKSNLRSKTIKKKIPSEMIYIAFGMCNRLDLRYYAIDLLSDVLSNGKSSRLYQSLVKEKNIFTHIDAYISGIQGEGLLVIEGQLMPDITLEQAEKMIFQEIEKLKKDLISEKELQKLKNKVESNLVFSDLSITNKAFNLAYYESLGKLSMINEEKDNYSKVNAIDIKEAAIELFVPENTIILKYQFEDE